MFRVKGFSIQNLNRPIIVLSNRTGVSRIKGKNTKPEMLRILKPRITMNIKSTYLYRDASNYKQYNQVVKVTMNIGWHGNFPKYLIILISETLQGLLRKHGMPVKIVAMIQKTVSLKPTRW